MGCKVGSDEAGPAEGGERRKAEAKEKERNDCVSGTHTGVGLDSFIGRAAHCGEKGREEGSGIGEPERRWGLRGTVEGPR